MKTKRIFLAMLVVIGRSCNSRREVITVGLILELVSSWIDCLMRDVMHCCAMGNNNSRQKDRTRVLSLISHIVIMVL